MTCTKEQRAEASRRNGRLSRGGLTPESRLKSSMNALKTGLRALTFSLPHESATVAERGEQWNTYYDPQSPAACHMVNECARATILADRCESYRQATIEEQTKDTHQRWKRKQRDKAYRLAKRLAIDPAGTMAELRRFEYGLKWIITEYNDFIWCVNNKGYLNQEGIDQVIRLYAGIEPVPEKITRNVMAYGLYTLHLGSALGVSVEEMDAWAAPANRPEELQEMTREEIVPSDARSAAEMLVETFEQEIRLLEVERQRIWDEEDEPSLQRKLEGASILTEEAARRVNRSHAESRTTFHRYWTALNKTLKTDAEEGRDEAPAVAGGPVAQGPADGVPNDPSFEADATAVMADETETSDDAPVSTEQRRAGPPEGARSGAERVEQGASNQETETGEVRPSRDHVVSLSTSAPAHVRSYEAGMDDAKGPEESVPDEAGAPGTRAGTGQRPREPGAPQVVGGRGRGSLEGEVSAITFERPAHISEELHDELVATYRELVEHAANRKRD